MEFPLDKILHFLAGLIIYVVFMELIGYWAIIPVVIIGAAKEIYDKVSMKGTPDIWDFIITVFGGLNGMILMYHSDLLIRVII